MDNSLDQYSKPQSIETTKLAKIFKLNFRDSKKGRLFMPIYDQRYPFVFEVKYSYISKFLEKNNASGNHYHKIKQEILIPLQGEFEFFFEDIETHEKETFTITGDAQKAVYVKTQVSHKIISRNETGILLVLASTPSSMDDEVEHSVS